MKALTLGPPKHERVVLFATGAGGDPERYRPLLEHLAADDCQVIAPHFERFAAREATTAELLARPAGLIEALQRWASEDADVVVVGHSIGGWAGLCLAGATPWGRDGRPLDVPREPRVGRLVLYAPATGWFAAPGALDAVTAPMLVFAGEMDTVTPVEQAVRLKSAPLGSTFASCRGLVTSASWIHRHRARSRTRASTVVSSLPTSRKRAGSSPSRPELV